VNLLPVLGVGRGDVVAVAGAGGKSSLVSALAREARDAGLRVAEAATAQRALAPLEPERIAALRAHHDLVLVECDGARGRWLKTPAAHEPVVPPCASMLLVVASLEAFGRPLLAEVVHRHERVAAASSRESGSTIDAWVITRALGSGYPDRRPTGARLVAFLNATESAEAWARAVGVASGLVPPYGAVFAGSARQGKAARVPVFWAVVLATGQPGAGEARPPAAGAVDALLAAGLQRVTVVLGRHAEDLPRAFPPDPRVELLREDAAGRDDPARLWRHAIEAHGSAADVALVVPATARGLGSVPVARLLSAAPAPVLAARDGDLVQALLFARERFPELLALEDGVDPEELLRRHSDGATPLAERSEDPTSHRNDTRV